MQQEGRDTALAILGAGLLALSAGYGCDDKEGSAPSWGGRGGGGWGQRGEGFVVELGGGFGVGTSR